ncbi:hypothetical protein JCM6882_008713 [Rhodosporidiobolus microsporus]
MRATVRALFASHQPPTPDNPTARSAPTLPAPPSSSPPKPPSPPSTFLSTCRTKLLAAYGVHSVAKPGPPHPHRREARCSTRGCPFKVVVKPRLAEWVIAARECEWEHDHDEGETKKASVRPVRKSQIGSAEGVKQLPTPGMPKAGDRFVDPDSVLVAAATALLPVYGYSVTYQNPRFENGSFQLRCSRTVNEKPGRPAQMCGFRFPVRKDFYTGEWVVQPSDAMEHNHPRHPALVLNPNYLPSLKKAKLRAAMGLPEVLVAKRPRNAKRRAASSISSVSDEEVFKMPFPKRSRTSTTLSANAPLSPPGPSQGAPSALRTPKHEDLDLPLPTPAPLALFLPPPLPPPPPPLYQPDLLFLPTLTSFLAGLSPSLAPLALHLAHLGIDSLKRLVPLVGLEAGERERLLEGLLEGKGVAGGKPSRVQVKMLAKALRAANEAG